MHELSVTQAVVDAIIERTGQKQVVRVHLEIGALSGIVVDSVRFCFDIVTEATPLAGAALEVDEPRGLGRCRSCGAEVELDDLLGMCRCGGIDMEVLAGEQLRIKKVEAESDVRDLRV